MNWCPEHLGPKVREQNTPLRKHRSELTDPVQDMAVLRRLSLGWVFSHQRRTSHLEATFIADVVTDVREQLAMRPYLTLVYIVSVCKEMTGICRLRPAPYLISSSQIFLLSISLIPVFCV